MSVLRILAGAIMPARIEDVITSGLSSYDPKWSYRDVGAAKGEVMIEQHAGSLGRVTLGMVEYGPSSWANGDVLVVLYQAMDRTINGSAFERAVVVERRDTTPCIVSSEILVTWSFDRHVKLEPMRS